MAERENIRSRLKKHQLTQVWLINQLGLRGIVKERGNRWTIPEYQKN